MNEAMRCEEAELSLPELALGSLSGKERALLVAHLGDCASCRKLSEGLIEVVDELVLLTPAADPPAGFESGVLAAITGDRPRQRLPSAHGRRALAVAALVAAFLGGSLIGGSVGPHRPRRPAAAPIALRAAALVGPGGATWGTAVVHAGRDGWVFVSMRWDLPDGLFAVQLAGPGIPTVQVGELDLAQGQASFERSVPADLSRVRAVRILDSSGTEICHASLA